MNILRPLGSLFVGLFLYLPTSIFAQCPVGDVVLSNQAAVDQFVIDYPSCTSIDGALTIGDHIAPYLYSDINDLSGLSNLSNINGDLNLRANPALATLNGLGGITDIGGSLNIIDNSGLNDLNGMANLQTVQLYVNIIDNDNMTSISGWNNLSLNFILTIKDNDALTTISGLNNLVANRAIAISENANLTTITGLNNINSGLTFALMDNPLLSSIAGFSFAGALSPVQITGNSQLATCNVAGVCDAIFAGLPNTIDANAAGCASAVDVQSSCLLGLPVELVYFNAVLEGQKVQLAWETSSEQNNLGFQVEYSVYGLQWRSLGFIEGHGNTTTTQNYNFTHDQPKGGKNYYRLQQLDYDGQFAYSEIEQVRLDVALENSLANVFPNPTAGPFTIQMNTRANIKSQLRLFDSRGKIVWKQDLAAEQESSTFTQHLDLPGNQLYFLYIQSGSDAEVQKIQTIDTF